MLNYLSLTVFFILTYLLVKFIRDRVWKSYSGLVGILIGISGKQRKKLTFDKNLTLFCGYYFSKKTLQKGEVQSGCFSGSSIWVLL